MTQNSHETKRDPRGEVEEQVRGHRDWSKTCVRYLRQCPKLDTDTLKNKYQNEDAVSIMVETRSSSTEARSPRL